MSPSSAQHIDMQAEGRTAPARILLTGGRGFVGRHLVRRLALDGYQCHLLVRSPSPAHIEGAHGEHVRGESADEQELADLLEKVRPDVVVHLASLFLATHKPEQVAPLVLSNVLFGTRLLEAMSLARVPCFLNAGTFWQHYQQADYDPVCLYAATKQAFEDIAEFYVRARGLQCVTLQLFDTYGPDDPRPKLFSLLLRSSQEGTELEMSPGEQQLDLVHISDVVSAFSLAIQRLLDGRVSGHEKYAVSSGRLLPLREVVRIFQTVSQRELRIVWGARPYRHREVMEPWKHGQPLPGWQPRVKLEDGLRSLFAQAGG